jgi:hypothetical protein
VSLAALLTREATLLQRSYDGPPDEYGDPTWQEVATDVPCELQPGGASEALGDAVQLSTWRLILGPAHVAATGWDAVELEGERYELVGDPAPFWNPRTRQYDHLEAIVQRVR